MANELINRAKLTDLDGDIAAKCLLVMLCDQADDDRICWPSVELMRKWIGAKSKRTVHAALRHLMEAGLVARVRTSRARIALSRRTNPYVYRLYPDAADLEESRMLSEPVAAAKASRGAESASLGDSRGVQSTTSRGAIYDIEGCRICTQTIKEPLIDPLKTTTARVRARDGDREGEDAWRFEPSQAHRAQARMLGVDVDAEAAKFVARVSEGGKIPDDPDAAFRAWLKRGADNGLAQRRGTPIPPRRARPPETHVHRWDCEHVLAALLPHEAEYDHARRGAFGRTSEWDAACDAKARELCFVKRWRAVLPWVVVRVIGQLFAGLPCRLVSSGFACFVIA